MAVSARSFSVSLNKPHVMFLNFQGAIYIWAPLPSSGGFEIIGANDSLESLKRESHSCILSGKSTLTSVYIKILEERYKQSGLRESVYMFLHRQGTTEENARKFSSMHWLDLRSSPNELPWKDPRI
jgi:hypothetical protein